MTTGAAARTCVQCHRAVPRVDRQGRCPRCYLREYRRARRERDPTYKPWQSRKRVRVSITLARDVRMRLDGVAPGERSSLVERLLRDALECALLVVDRDGTLVQAEGSAYAENPRVHLGRKIDDVFQGNPSVLQGFRAALAGRRLSNEMEFRGRRWAVRWAPLRDSARRVQEVIAVAYRLGEEGTEADARRS
jgi:hypothetical protein